MGGDRAGYNQNRPQQSSNQNYEANFSGDDEVNYDSSPRKQQYHDHDKEEGGEQIQHSSTQESALQLDVGQNKKSNHSLKEFKEMLINSMSGGDSKKAENSIPNLHRIDSSHHKSDFPRRDSFHEMQSLSLHFRKSSEYHDHAPPIIFNLALNRLKRDLPNLIKAKYQGKKFEKLSDHYRK